MVKIQTLTKSGIKYIDKNELTKQFNKFSEPIIDFNKKKKQLIVSLTSYPERLYDLHFTLFSLCQQTLKPNKILLWLSKEEFPNREDDLTNEILKLQSLGLSICWDEGNIKQYKKLIPSLKKFPKDIIVTADDDIYYPNNWLEILYKSYLKNPNAIHAHRVHKILISDDGKLLPYKNWHKELNYDLNPISYRNFATGAGGILYPPNSFHKDILKKNLFFKICPTNDDIWFWGMSVLNKKLIKKVENNISTLIYTNPDRELGLNKEKTLLTINCLQGNNDKQFKNLFNRYMDLKKILIHEKNNKLITFFSHSSQLGGAERSMIELISELKEKNIFSHVILPNQGPLEEKLNELNVSYDILGLNWWAGKQIMSDENLIIDNDRVLKNLLNFMPKLSLINPDLIYSNTIVSPWGAIAANYLKKPHLWHAREYGDLDHNFKFTSSYEEIIKFIDNYSDQIVVNSKSLKNHFGEYLEKNKPIVAYNFISNIDEKLLLKKIKNPFVNKNSLKILVAATVHEGKNQLEAIKVINNLIENGVDVELLLLGFVADENYFNKLKEYIKKHNLNEKIHFKGFVNNPYTYFLESDVVLVPSFKEAYGRTAVEGMLLKKPVIVTKEGGSNEIVNDGKTGFSYHVGDLKTLEEILIKLTSKTVREKIANQAYKSIKQINNKENYGYKIAKIIKQTIKDYQPRNKLTNIALNVFEKNHKELSQTQQELNKISSSLEKKKSLEKEINQIKNEIDNLESDLNKIQSAKFFKLWQGYNKLKKLI